MVHLNDANLGSFRNSLGTGTR